MDIPNATSESATEKTPGAVAVNKPSVLHIHSVGVAADNLPLNSMILEVNPIEVTPQMNGEVTSEATKMTVTSKDSLGASDETQVITTVTYQATWIPFGSNRFTPPNIRRGEKVLIWKIGDADVYYWSEYEYNPDLRKLETVILLFSNTQVEGEKASSKNSVYLEVSTHNKAMHFRWPNSDGEPHAWDIQLNAKESILIVTDDIENQFSIESQEKRVQLINADKTRLTLDKRNGHFFAPEDMFFESGRNMEFKVGGAMSHNVVSTWTWQTGGNVTGTMPEASYTSANTSFSGNASIGKMTTTGGFLSKNTESEGFKVSGSGRFDGGFKVVGDVDVQGSIHATSSVTGSNIS